MNFFGMSVELFCRGFLLHNVLDFKYFSSVSAMAVFTTTMLLFSLLTLGSKIYNAPPQHEQEIAGEVVKSSVLTAAGMLLPPPYGMAVEGVQLVMNTNYWLSEE